MTKTRNHHKCMNVQTRMYTHTGVDTSALYFYNNLISRYITLQTIVIAISPFSPVPVI